MPKSPEHLQFIGMLSELEENDKTKVDEYIIKLRDIYLEDPDRMILAFGKITFEIQDGNI
jgi:hypothetical protein